MKDKENKLNFRENELTLSEWVRQAPPGAMYTYATVRHLTDSFMARKIGIEAWKMAVKGTIYLVQKRVPMSIPSMFDYIAIKASNPPIRSLITSDYGDPTERSPYRVAGQTNRSEISEVV